MSFKEQERVLFDLLFDDVFRQNFSKNSALALTNYNLTDQEKSDFHGMRLDALAMDVDMRKRLILAQISNLLPLSFSVVSSLQGGLRLLQGLITVGLMKVAPHKRLNAFSAVLITEVEALSVSEYFHSSQERKAVLAVLATEAGLANTASLLKQALLNDHYLADVPSYYEEDDPSWLDQPVQWADYVCTHTLNQPYMHLKKKLCPVSGTALWQHLSDNPLPAFLREEALMQDDGRVVVSKACVTHHSEVDPVVDHITVELSLGFAPMFAYIDGSSSIADLLQNLVEAGAPKPLITSVKSGFYQLMQCGMLKIEK